MIAAALWHTWIAYPLMGAAIVAAVGLVGGYVKKVIRPKYPR